jgi:FlaA1/EpsC-like NDP-sugar epimerase/8-oxo-dGTP pyrophosphatase MutT (NUDIX family)
MTLGARCLLLSKEESIILVKHRYQLGWHLPGGGMRPGETVKYALRREVLEEAGIEIVGEPKLHGVFLNDKISRRDHVSVYISDNFKKIPNAKISWEISECREFPIDALPSDIEPGTKNRILEAIGQSEVSEFWRLNAAQDSHRTSKNQKNSLRSILIGLPRARKILLQIFFDLAALLGAYSLSIGMHIWGFPAAVSGFSWKVVLPSIAICILFFYSLGLYRSIIRYTSSSTLVKLAFGCSAFVTSSLAFSQLFDKNFHWATAVDLLLISSALTVGGRYLMRLYLRAQRTQTGKSVIIYGASESARQLLASLQQGSELNPIAFVDQNGEHKGAIIGGVKVYGHDRLLELIKRHKVETILIATRAVSRQVRKDLAEVLSEVSVAVQIIPDASAIMSGLAKITDLREIKIEELLGRETIPAISQLMSAKTKGKSVAITGAGGSIGGELCRQILRLEPKRLLLIESSEPALFDIGNQLREQARREGLSVPVISTLGSTADTSLLTQFLKKYNVDTVFHAAAFKHVPMLEDNILSAVRNNIFGTASVLEASIASGVSSFTMISTDKAVRPTNVMGATKRTAELVCQAHAQGQGNTTISMVRFGNVLGSSGSVIPFFRQQISTGGPITVTHEAITRYFMTIPEAAQLVIQSSGMAQGGEVFHLDMGEPIRILDLAQSMIRLSGYEPILSNNLVNGRALSADEIEIIISGLRPGEKLYEELLVGADAIKTDHPRIMMAEEEFISMGELELYLDELLKCFDDSDKAGTIEILQRMPLEYNPHSPSNLTI